MVTQCAGRLHAGLGQCGGGVPFAGSVNTSSAPKARSRMRRSRDMEAGMVSTSLYPFAAAMNANPMPVLPAAE